MLTNTTGKTPRSAAAGFGRLRHAAVVGGAASLAAAALLLCGGLVGAPAHAAPAATQTPPVRASAPPSSAPSAAVAPTISVPDSATNRVVANGTGTPGASYRVLDPAHPASSLCTGRVAADGSWSCSVTLGNGAGQTLTVRDLTDTSLADVTSQPFSVLGAPVVTTRAGVLVGAKLAGTGFAGATVKLGLATAAGTSTVVTTTVASDGSWQTILAASAVPTGAYTLTATQSSAAVPAVPTSSASAPLRVTVDRVAPAAPVIVAPSPGVPVTTQPFSFSGTGETGDTVTTYVDSNPVCRATVVAGRWSCRTTGLLLPAGTLTMQAAQVDPAGNYGPASKAVPIVIAAATASPGSTPSPSTGPSSAPASGAPSATPSGSATATPPGATGGSSSGGTGSPGGSNGTSAGGRGGSAGSGGSSAITGGVGSSGGLTAQAAAASWTGPTGFGRNLPTFAQSLSGWSWPIALALGLVFALLVIAPLRLATALLGGRIAVRARRFTGRNRSRRERDERPVLSRTSALALTIAGGALLVVLSIGVDNQLRYVRLLIAVVIGLMAINGVAIVLPTFVFGRRLGLAVRLRVSPWMLAVAAVACLLTRVLALDPPMVLGVLVAASVVDRVSLSTAQLPTQEADVRRRGILATLQLASLIVLSFAAWVVHGLLPANTSLFAVEIGRETLATICLAGLGSLIVLLIPLSTLPGRALFTWSRSTLLGLAVVGVAAAGVVFAGDPDEVFPIVPFVVAAVAFAVVITGAWVWVRFVEPMIDDR